MSKAQPSIKTNNINLKGREISIGESIIIPMAIKTLATTRSMIKKGIKIKKPIWKAVFNSLVTNEGSNKLYGMSCGVCISS